MKNRELPCIDAPAEVIIFFGIGRLAYRLRTQTTVVAAVKKTETLAE